MESEQRIDVCDIKLFTAEFSPERESEGDYRDCCLKEADGVLLCMKNESFRSLNRNVDLRVFLWNSVRITPYEDRRRKSCSIDPGHDLVEDAFCTTR